MATKRAPKRKSTSRFNLAPQVNIQRSTFDLSFPVKTTFDSGILVPLPPIEILPGDSMRARMTSLCRLATPLHPTMDNLTLESFFFFVPNRLVWDNWQKFMGEQDNPGDSTDFQVPVCSSTSAISGNSNFDYMGLPVAQPNILNTVSMLPLRGMNLCYNEWFRDENLQDSLPVPKDDGPDPASNYTALYRRGKRKNYLTSALPWPQKGPGVDLPLGVSAPVFLGAGSGGTIKYGDNAGNAGDPSTISGVTGESVSAFNVANTQLSGLTGTYPDDVDVYVDLTQATAATINDLRQAFQIQKLQERDARGGTRYTELLRSHFQVISPDQRLQRPEYLGGGSSAIQMNTVPQTSSTDATTPQGNLSAYGVSTISGHGFTKSFVEHGYVLGFVSVRADLTFQRKVDRHWSRSTKYDFYWPALQGLGEQAILQKEIYADGTAQDNTVWGYQERWAELRSLMGHVTGKFRSGLVDTLDPWHYALDFGATPPALNASFIEDNPPVERTVAVQDQPEFIFDAWMDIRAARPLPVYSVPGYIDHF